MTRNGTTAAQRTATGAAHTMYVTRKKEIAAKMANLRANLAAHAKAENNDKADWGFAGDLAFVSEKLDEIMEFVNASDLGPTA